LNALGCPGTTGLLECNFQLQQLPFWLRKFGPHKRITIKRATSATIGGSSGQNTMPKPKPIPTAILERCTRRWLVELQGFLAGTLINMKQ